MHTVFAQKTKSIHMKVYFLRTPVDQFEAGIDVANLLGDLSIDVCITSMDNHTFTMASIIQKERQKFFLDFPIHQKDLFDEGKERELFQAILEDFPNKKVLILGKQETIDRLKVYINQQKVPWVQLHSRKKELIRV